MAGRLAPGEPGGRGPPGYSEGSHPKLAVDLEALAETLWFQGKLAESEPLYYEALAIRRKTLPAGHPEIARSLGLVAWLLKDEGRFAEAEVMARFRKIPDDQAMGTDRDFSYDRVAWIEVARVHALEVLFAHGRLVGAQDFIAPPRRVRKEYHQNVSFA